MKTASLSLALMMTLVGLAAAGCGSSAGVSGDGGADAQSSETAPADRQSFDVTATLTGTDGGISSLPATSTFTLVLDVAARQAIVGARGHAATVAATSTNGRTFHLAPFSVGSGGGGACEGVSSIDYKTFDVTISGGTLQGKATGMAEISCGDCFFNVSFAADVGGVADATAPFLIASGAVAVSPFTGMTFLANEPLPTTATARLETSTGAHIDLLPLSSDAEPSLVYGFGTPNVVLPPADGYVVSLDGLVDFAGHTGAAGASLRLTGFSAPLLLPADGFESATGTQVGGAAVIGASAPLPPISGAKSVYFGGAGAPAIPGATFGSALRVRLAAQPGNTKLRFSYRIVSQFGGGAFPYVYVGSVGRPAAPAQGLDASANGTSQMTWPNGEQVTVTVVATKEIALPADVTDEVIVSIEAFGNSCGGPALAPSGVEIDDLALE